MVGFVFQVIQCECVTVSKTVLFNVAFLISISVAVDEIKKLIKQQGIGLIFCYLCDWIGGFCSFESDWWFFRKALQFCCLLCAGTGEVCRFNPWVVLVVLCFAGEICFVLLADSGLMAEGRGRPPEIRVSTACRFGGGFQFRC